jgi:arabinosaccharide transport system substrate-binding protein
MLAIALISSAIVALRPGVPQTPTKLWLFSRQHEGIYRDVIARWNRDHPAARVELSVIGVPVMEQRMMSGFLSDTPVANLMEIERTIAGHVFTGPIDRVGFADLTSRLRNEGLLDQINAPSFGPWTSRGRIFGIPHDVHPVMLVYRSDLVEAAGIDVSRIETWEDFFRVMSPLMKDLDDDGRVDRYLLNTAPVDHNALEVLLLQAGGHIFDDQERLTINAPRNAEILARLATWYTGPHRVCRFADIVNTASGQQNFEDGLVVAALAPDWVAGLLKQQIPALAGKVKLMPLPAWEHGGTRTSVWGGTMLGIAKSSKSRAIDWELAKLLYFSPETAVRLFRATGIVTAVKSNWSNPAFDQPDPYFSGQPVGRLYIDLAPSIPRRTSSPYNQPALFQMTNCLIELVDYADRQRAFEWPALVPEAQRLLDVAQHAMQAEIDRNVFLAKKP